MNPNPYKSPTTNSLISTGLQSPANQDRTIRSDLWRGAKVGFCSYLVILIFCIMAFLVGLVVSPDFRNHMFSELGEVTFLQIAKAIGGLLGIVALGIPYGAIPGALIMGIAAAARRRLASKTTGFDETSLSKS